MGNTKQRFNDSFNEVSHNASLVVSPRNYNINLNNNSLDFKHYGNDSSSMSANAFAVAQYRPTEEFKTQFEIFKRELTFVEYI